MLAGPRRNRPSRPVPRVPLVVAVALLALLGVGPVAADTPDPHPWPTATGLDPGIETSAHSLRVAGDDRYQTGLSASLLLRGAGGYPFTTADRTSGEATAVAEADDWWGLDTCPFSVIVTAGDTAADSLAAASLSDPTDGSSEPELTRSAAADPGFDPVGGTSRVDTDSAPIIVTASARDGADRLSAAARTAVVDLAEGGCLNASAAIVVGGEAAVPPEVDQQLVDLGYDEVFRVAGQNRYATAAAIAGALGTGEAVSADCLDPDATDGGTATGFHGNAAVEYRTSAVDCQVLDRTIVLTDGITGADALAAGWWTSQWQVPVLLVDANGDLPPATENALDSLVVHNVVVLGGQGRVPEETVAEVETLTGASSVRVAGEDRYATSVEMAAAFGGWFDTGDAADHDASLVCLAASSGSGAESVGWPDALGAGPWCARAGGAASGTTAPVRGLPPTAGASPRTTRGGPPSHDAVPVLLAPVGAIELPAPVSDLLEGVFDPAATWCSSVQSGNGCLDPGFVVAFGGGAVLPEAAVRDAAVAVSGRTYVVFTDLTPAAGTGFWTALDLRPVYAQGGVTEDAAVGRVCLGRGQLSGVRWLATYTDTERTGFGAEHDLLTRGRYMSDHDLVARSPGKSAPSCVRVGDIDSGTVSAVGASLSGHVSGAGTFAVGDEHRLVLSGPIVQSGAENEDGTDTGTDDQDAQGSSSQVLFADGDLQDLAITSRGEPAALTSASIDLELTRGSTQTDPDTFTATLTLGSSRGDVVANVAGEAHFDGEVWRLRGRVTYTGDDWNVAAGAGGFTADLEVHSTDSTDDVLTWRLDGLVRGEEGDGG